LISLSTSTTVLVVVGLSVVVSWAAIVHWASVVVVLVATLVLEPVATHLSLDEEEDLLNELNGVRSLE
jgi:hypothetical protein